VSGAEGLELQRAPEEKSCRLCGDPFDDVCPKCGIDRSGDLVKPPAAASSGPVRDGTRPLRRRAARLLAESMMTASTRTWLLRALRESLQGLPGTILCGIFVGVSLSFQRIPWVNEPMPWPGQLMSAFVLSFLTIEHARGSREGQKGAMDTKGAFDPSQLGLSLLMAILLTPLYAGPFMGNPYFTAVFALPVILLFPAFLGALVTDSAQELSLTRLKEAIVESPRYLRTAVVAMTCLVGGLLAVWLPSDQSPLWRAPLAVLGATFAGVLCGMMRRDAECMIDDDDGA
jgi:hypothetical protein